jgi:RNA-directed DNA polymerase
MPDQTKATLFKTCTTRSELAALLEISPSTLTFLAFAKGKKYKTFDIPKKGGGTRTITAPDGALKTIQRKLAEILNELYPKPPYVLGFVKGGSILANASPHIGKKVVLNIDLKDFFPSITASRVIGLFRAEPFKFNNEVVSTLAGLLCHNGSLPQGAPTSPIVSNMIAYRMDRELCALSKRGRITYTRYADDLTFSTSKKILPLNIVKQSDDGLSVELGDELRTVISSNYFSVNDKKTRMAYGPKAKFVTGVKVNLKPNLANSYTRQVRSMLHSWKTHKIEGAQADFVSKYSGGKKSFVNVLRGKLAHIKNIKGDTDLSYRRLYNRFVSLENNGHPPLPLTDIENLWNKVLVVECEGRYGTGFILNESFLVTARHNILSADTTTIAQEIKCFKHNESTSATFQEYLDTRDCQDSKEMDIAVLPLKGAYMKYKTCSLCLTEPYVNVNIGESYQIVGFQYYFRGSTPYTIPVARVTNIQKNSHVILDAFVDKKLVGGCSGGPVLDNHNQVVGIVLRGEESYSVGNIFLPIQEMRRFFIDKGITNLQH